MIWVFFFPHHSATKQTHATHTRSILVFFARWGRAGAHLRGSSRERGRVVSALTTGIYLLAESLEPESTEISRVSFCYSFFLRNLSELDCYYSILSCCYLLQWRSKLTFLDSLDSLHQLLTCSWWQEQWLTLVLPMTTWMIIRLLLCLCLWLGPGVCPEATYGSSLYVMLLSSSCDSTICLRHPTNWVVLGVFPSPFHACPCT